MENIGFIGAGNMASSLIRGLLQAGYDRDNIMASDPTPSAQCQQLGIKIVNDNQLVSRWADMLVLAVKPQTLQSVCGEIADAVSSQETVIISIAAGIRTASILHWLQATVPCIRVMPNTPAMHGAGMSGMYANQHATRQHIDSTTTIMQTVGKTLWLASEEMLDAVTAVSGSGPAYFFLLIEHMIKAAREQGLGNDDATLLATQTALGAATMAAQPGTDVADLRQRVTSPGGTTERAIETLVNGGFPQLVQDAIQAATDRSRELSAILGDSADD